ncbi:hypothetical protein D3C85_1037060 [compost metagenome]
MFFRVTILITPAKASLPNKQAEAPFIISILSILETVIRDRSRLPLLRPTMGCPSIMIIVYPLSKPCICKPTALLPAPMSFTIASPVCSFNTSSSRRLPICSISFRLITVAGIAVLAMSMKLSGLLCTPVTLTSFKEASFRVRRMVRVFFLPSSMTTSCT